MNNHFKALCHNGTWVDTRILHDGIYPSLVPFLYPKDETIEGMIRKFKPYHRLVEHGEEFLNNLSKCELVDVTIEIHISKSEGPNRETINT